MKEKIKAFVVGIILGTVLGLGLLWAACEPVYAAEGVPIAENIRRVAPDVVRVYAAPVAYQDARGGWNDIDVAYTAGSDARAIRKTKGIRGVEIDKTTGSVTLRGPAGDPCTLTLTLESCGFNAVSKIVNIAPATARSAALTDLGGLLVMTRANGCRVLVPAPAGTRGFSISFRVGLDGLAWSERGGRFVFTSTRTGKVLFVFRAPGLCDMDGNRLADAPDGQHSLVADEEIGLRYTKSMSGLDKLSLPKEYLVDVDVVYSTTGDGYVSLSNYAAGSWADAVALATGTGLSNTATSSNYSMQAYTDSGPLYNINRSFFYFDLSGLSGVFSGAKLYVKVAGAAAPKTSVSVFQGTQAATLTTADYDSFTGPEFGRVAWPVADSWAEILLDASGIAYLNGLIGSGTAKLCLREYEHDVLVSAPAVGAIFANGCYYANSPGNEPYLELTLSPPVTGTSNVVRMIF